ncbi:MAG: glycoside hydrolase family 2 [Clostridia bacterium]|nr:glycoside hydrolase family 2 [Clostridia bacterium]
MNWNEVYPRPQFKRESFFSLNGEWLLNGSPIQVPFPPESYASGYEGELLESMTYDKVFSLPEDFLPEGYRAILHFGAVDQICEVFINGHSVCIHEGGYLPFSEDITNELYPGKNKLRVQYTDSLDQVLPYGKQRKKRGGMWYTPVSGIWQSVWIEAVPQKAIRNIKITPDLTGIDLKVEADTSEVTVIIPDIVRMRVKSGESVRIDIPSPRLWSPKDPNLYDIIFTNDFDRVKSYFALRTIGTKVVKGRSRIVLNDKPIFLNGVLDQGYFEDGIYLPSSPEAYETDIRNMKKHGMNLLRKHIKIECEAFYEACDRLGMLVMQDMVNNGKYNFIIDTALSTIGLKFKIDSLFGFESNESRRVFTQHAVDTINHLYNHPCIVSYTIFNEGWGQFHADRHYKLLKDIDPTRLYDATSGWFHQRKSDFDSHHVYFKNKRLRGKKRPVLLSECGGYARAIEGHMFPSKKRYGYGSADSQIALTKKIDTMWKEMVFPSIPLGLSGVIYTQLSDVEDEINGLYTYDREIQKADDKRLSTLATKAQSMIDSLEGRK